MRVYNVNNKQYTVKCIHIAGNKIESDKTILEYQNYM